MKKLTLLFVMVIVTITSFSQVSIEPAFLQMKVPINIDTISTPELGDIVLNINDTTLYLYDGIDWLPLNYNLYQNTECCPSVKFYNFLGEPTQEIFETIFGHSPHNYIGTLYSPVQDKAWSFTYIYLAPQNNWKWIALKD